MLSLDAKTLELFWHDNDHREELLRRVITERLRENPPPTSDEHVIATYFFAFRTMRLDHAVEEISYHATTGVKHPPAGWRRARPGRLGWTSLTRPGAWGCCMWPSR
jgi:hypothetical protein